MEYVLLIYVPETWAQLSDDERKALYEEYWALCEAPGFIDEAQLAPADTATTVRVQGGRTLVTDGPFALADPGRPDRRLRRGAPGRAPLGRARAAPRT